MDKSKHVGVFNIHMLGSPKRGIFVFVPQHIRFLFSPHPGYWKLLFSANLTENTCHHTGLIVCVATASKVKPFFTGSSLA